MYTLSQSLLIKGPAGDPLPTVWDSLDAKGARFLRGQLCLICAGPGTGKSAFVLTYALHAGVPTLYISADSDPFTQLSRSVSILTGWPMERSTRMLREDWLEEDAWAAIADIPIRFTYSASPSLDHLEEEMLAYDEVYGDYPALIVVDNVTNVRTGAESNADDPFEGLEALMDYLHDMARETSACVIGLHHVTGGYNDCSRPIPLSGVKGQISRVPEMILTMHRVSEGFGADSLRVSTVKNRGGPEDPSGRDYTELQFCGETMQIRDFSGSRT